MFLHCLLGQGIAALPADLADVKSFRIELAAALQDPLNRCHSMGANPAIGAFIDSADISQSSVAFLIQQIGYHLFLTTVKVHLHLVELIVVLVGVHKNNGKGEGAEEVDLRFAEYTERNDAVHLLGLAEGQPNKRNIVLICHHLHQTGQRGQPHIVPVRTDDPPVRYPDDQVGLVFRCPPLPGGDVTKSMSRLKNTSPHLWRNGDVVIFIQNPGDCCGRDLGSLGHILDRRHESPPSQVLLSSLYFSPVRSQ